MDIETQFDGIRDRIREDYGILDNSVEYVATVVLCWGNKKYREQREVVKDFMNLRESGLIPWYVTIEDMKAWMISRDQNIIKERFQREDSDRKDDLIYLTWEVNVRLKLLEIMSYASRACKRARRPSPGRSQRPSPPLGPQLPTGQDPHLAALADLQCGNAGVVPPSAFALHYHYFYTKYPPRFDARAVVQQALKDIIHALAYPPASRPQALPDVVLDTVACLFQVIMDEGRAGGGAGGGATEETDMRLLSGMAVGTVISVLCEVRADVHLTVEFPRAARARAVAWVLTELQRSAGSAQALKGALCAKETRTAAAISTAVTVEIRRLCHAAHASPSTAMALPALGEEAVAGATATEEVESAERQDDSAEPPLDDLRTAVPQVVVMEQRELQQTRDTAAVSTAITAAVPSAGMTVMERGGDAIAGATESKEVEPAERQDDTAEPPLADLGTAAPQVDVMEDREMEDAETRDTAAVSTAITAAVPSAGMTVMERGGDAIAGATESKEVEPAEKLDDAAEPPLDDLGTAAPQVDVMEERKMEDACAVDAQKGPKGLAEGDCQPGDRPQKRGTKSAVWRLFGRVWTALKSSLCCCSVSEEGE